MNRLLVIFAHPDDESFGPAAGTLAKYAFEGVAVHYLCATRGEAGEVDNLRGHSDIRSLRTSELYRAAAVLRLRSVQFMNYRDSGMAGAAANHHPDSLFSAPLEAVSERIIKAIHTIRPDVILTHDPYGWYGHPDHIKCCQAVLRAYERLYGFTPGDAPADESLVNPNAPRLYLSTFPKGLLRLAVVYLRLTGRNPRQHGQNKDVDLVQIASWDVPATARLAVGAYQPIKELAMSCHASQRPLTESHSGLWKWLMNYSQQQESFARLYPPVSPGEQLETELFPAPSVAYGLRPAASRT
jgi:LmbE family N-acetylglucosaminyl deacetylase